MNPPPNRPASRVIPTHMESAVTKLLVATRQLLESLQMWSAMTMSDLEVSDTYVRLGNDFNNAVAAFVTNGVSMDDLLSVPQDLRECLESLLALDPTPENLDIYLPRVRGIIVQLLSGLKAKQAVYRKIAATKEQPREQPREQGRDAGDARGVLLARAEGRDGRGSVNGFYPTTAVAGAAGRRSGSRSPEPSVPGRSSSDRGPTDRGPNGQTDRGSRPPQRPELPAPSQMISSSSSASLASDRHLSSTTTTSAAAGGTLPSRMRNGPLPPAPPDAFRPPRRRVTPSSGGDGRPRSPRTPVEQGFFPDSRDSMGQGRALPSVPSVPPPVSSVPSGASTTSAAMAPAAPSAPAGTPPMVPTRSAERERFALRDAPSPSPNSSPIKPPRNLDEPVTQEPVTPPRRRSVVSKRSSGGSVPDVGKEVEGYILGSRFSLDSEATDTPKTRRRMTGMMGLSDAEGGLTRLASLEEGLSVDTTSKPRAPTETVDVPPSTTTESPAALASLTALQNSEALGRRASKRFSQYQYKQLLPGHPKAGSSSGMRHGRMGSVAEDGQAGDEVAGPSGSPGRPVRRVQSEVPPVPPIPEQMLSREQESVEPPPIPTIVVPDEGIEEPRPQPPTETIPEPTNDVPVFLQYGRETKKVVLDRREVTSIADLQGLFMNKFEYAPEGREMFPDVYVRDGASGIAYQLEDMDDVKPGVLLSLNIDQLDQVKQHFDNTISGLLHEIKELKHNVAQNRRLSAYKPEHSTLSPSMHPVDRPSARSPRIHSRPSSPVPAIANEPAATTTEATTSIGNLHVQLDDVQSLRRDLGVMRQQYVDFVNQSKTAFQTIRDQTQSMREISTSKLSGSRALLNNGKAALEKDSIEVVRAVEEVSDAIDTVKDDVVRRQILPPPHRMEQMRKNLAEAEAHVEKLKSRVSLVAPAWKATWNEELSTVLEEQRLLKYHESLAADLEGDIEQARGIFGTLTEYMAQRGAGMTRRQFRPPVPKGEEPAVPNLLLEIRTRDADPNRRLRAIEEQQRARERERAAKGDDEFAAELGGFVAGRKLKKTGGTEEAERVRLRKQEVSLKKMFAGEVMTPGKALEAVPESPVVPNEESKE